MNKYVNVGVSEGKRERNLVKYQYDIQIYIQKYWKQRNSIKTVVTFEGVGIQEWRRKFSFKIIKMPLILSGF